MARLAAARSAWRQEKHRWRASTCVRTSRASAAWEWRQQISGRRAVLLLLVVVVCAGAPERRRGCSGGGGGAAAAAAAEAEAAASSSTSSSAPCGAGDAAAAAAAPPPLEGGWTARGRGRGRGRGLSEVEEEGGEEAKCVRPSERGILFRDRLKSNTYYKFLP